MKRVLNLMVCALALLSVSQVSAWDAKGHCVIAHIADQNLTPKARKMCSKYLGHSLAYYASWMDMWRYSDEYHHTARWHAVGFVRLYIQEHNFHLMPVPDKMLLHTT